jgi:hypothetical protein
MKSTPEWVNNFLKNFFNHFFKGSYFPFNFYAFQKMSPNVSEEGFKYIIDLSCHHLQTLQKEGQESDKLSHKISKISGQYIQEISAHVDHRLSLKKNFTQHEFWNKIAEDNQLFITTTIEKGDCDNLSIEQVIIFVFISLYCLILRSAARWTSCFLIF